MKHEEAKAFVRKYNSELSIKGYSKMRKEDLVKVIETTLKKSRKELQAEWKLKKGKEGTAFKRGTPARLQNLAVKSGPKRGTATKQA